MGRVRGALRRRWRVVLGVALLTLFFFGICMPAAAHMADTVSITVTADYYGRQPSRVVFERTISDAGVAHAVQDAVNAVPMADAGATSVFYNGCGEGSAGYVYRYEFRFSWRGIPLQDATKTSAGCSDLDVTTLGLPELGRRAPVPLDWARLHDLTGLPLWQFPA